MKLIQMAMKGAYHNATTEDTPWRRAPRMSVGELQKQLTEEVLINMLESASEGNKVTIQRRKVDVDDDSDNDDDLY